MSDRNCFELYHRLLVVVNPKGSTVLSEHPVGRKTTDR